MTSHALDWVDPTFERVPRANQKHGWSPPSVEAVHNVAVRMGELGGPKGTRQAIELGQLFIDAFFDGDVALMRTQSGKTGLYRMLVDHPAVRWSHSCLRYCVGIAAQAAELPPEAIDGLPLTAHRVLLQVHDVEQKRELADLCLKHPLSTRQLQSHIRQLRPEAIGRRLRGRPPLPPLVKALRLHEQGLDLARAHPIESLCAPNMGRGATAELAARLERVAAETAHLAATLRALG